MTPTIPEYDDPARAGAYGKRPGTTRAEVRALRRLLSGRGPGAVALDVPCGNGRLAGFLAGRGSATLLGADGAPAMARAARPRYALTFAADASLLPLADRSADLVLCVRLLHHFPGAADRVTILRELARVSRGLVAFSFYRRGTLEGLRRRFRPKRRSGRVGLSLRAVRADLAAAGLVELRRASLLRLVREQSFLLASVPG